jgi:hypothetical protein
MINIVTSYFYMIRNFTPNIIPVSTAMSDPTWYRPPKGKEYYIDKRGVVCGLRYEPLIVQRYGGYECPGPEQCWYAGAELIDPQGKSVPCPTMQEYEQLLYSFVDKEKTLWAFEHCCNKFNADTIALIVYEAPTNPCSERWALQRFFGCKEWSGK